MDLTQLSTDILKNELRTRGIDPRGVVLAQMDELATELSHRGPGFVSAIFVVNEETMAAKIDGKIGIIHEGDPILQMRLACRVFHDTGYDLVKTAQLTKALMREIVEEELGDLFDFGDESDE